MRYKLTKKDIGLLKYLGFKEEYPDEVDPTFCLYRKNIKNHPLMKGLHLMIDDGINVYCREDKMGISGYDVLIARYEFSEEKLLSLLIYLT